MDYQVQARGIPWLSTTSTMIMFAAPLQASGIGLKVDVYIHGTSCVSGQTANIIISTTQDFTESKSVVIPATESITCFQFEPNEVAVGDQVFMNVDVGGLHGSGSTTNGSEKAPERIDVNLDCSSNNE